MTKLFHFGGGKERTIYLPVFNLNIHHGVCNALGRHLAVWNQFATQLSTPPSTSRFPFLIPVLQKGKLKKSEQTNTLFMRSWHVTAPVPPHLYRRQAHVSKRQMTQRLPLMPALGCILFIKRDGVWIFKQTRCICVLKIKETSVQTGLNKTKLRDKQALREHEEIKKRFRTKFLPHLLQQHTHKKNGLLL